MKDFLRGLKEPLVTFGLWKDFVGAAGNKIREREREREREGGREERERGERERGEE